MAEAAAESAKYATADHDGRVILHRLVERYALACDRQVRILDRFDRWPTRRNLAWCQTCFPGPGIPLDPGL